MQIINLLINSLSINPIDWLTINKNRSFAMENARGTNYLNRKVEVHVTHFYPT